MKTSPAILCGHSFAGKVCLLYLKHCLDRRLSIPKHTWVLDSLPGLYDRRTDRASPDSVVGILDSLATLPSTFPSQVDAKNSLASLGLSKPICDWLATSLVPVGGGPAVRFGFELSIVRDLFADFAGLDLWDFLHTFKQQQQQSGEKIHFIRAG